MSIGALIFAAACKKDESKEAAQHLKKAFATSEPQAKEAIARVNAGLNSRNYSEVAGALNPILARGDLSLEQKQALGATLQQLNQAVASKPELDTKEMFELRAKISKVLTAGPRF